MQTLISAHNMTIALAVNAIKRSRVEKPGNSVTPAQINMPNAVLAVSDSILCCSTAPTPGYRVRSSALQQYPNRSVIISLLPLPAADAVSGEASLV